MHSTRALLWWFLLSPFLAAVLTAQDKPDFSGSWVLQEPSPPGADVARALTIRQPLRRTTARGEPMPPVFLELTVEKQFEADVRTERYFIGTESGTGGVTPDRRSNPPRPPPTETRISVRWDGPQLRIETRSYDGLKRNSAAYIEHSELWRLDQQGRLVIVIVDRRSESDVVTTRTLTYRRE